MLSRGHWQLVAGIVAPVAGLSPQKRPHKAREAARRAAGLRLSRGVTTRLGAKGVESRVVSEPTALDLLSLEWCVYATP
jgi:hypothetical protein